jgi:protein TonB
MSGSGTSGDPLLSGLGGIGENLPPPLPDRRMEIHEHTRVVTIGGNVASANLIRRVEPSYPPLAKAARIQGEVVFQAVIGVDGQIRNLQLEQGHPLLVEAARNAIAQWRYRPTLLNGKPVEIATTITVRFSLSQ